jgi:DNA-binding NarL/FixJ family response regulator
MIPTVRRKRYAWGNKISSLNGIDKSADEHRQEAVGVLVVDDFGPFLEIAHDVIAEAPGFEPVGEVSTGREAMAVADELDPELAIVDIRMPGMNGIELTRKMKTAHPEMVVLLITGGDLAEVSPDAHRCGAAAIVRKEEFGPRLLARVWGSERGAG